MKDYYKILGILNDAEEIIIRAAYRALAQKYHPDKWSGDAKDANRRMSEINEAYEVLSEKEKREKYDSEYFSNHQRNETQEDENSEDSNFISEEDEAWDLGLSFYPNIKSEYEELTKISRFLGNSFKAKLIDGKLYDQSKQIKNNLEKSYLEKYYGDNKKIQEFAKNLLLNDYKKEAIQVNKIVRLIGSSITYDQIYKKILGEFSHLQNDRKIYDKAGIKKILSDLHGDVYAKEKLVHLYVRFIGKELRIESGIFSTIFLDGNISLNQEQVRRAIIGEIMKSSTFKP